MTHQGLVFFSLVREKNPNLLQDVWLMWNWLNNSFKDKEATNDQPVVFTAPDRVRTCCWSLKGCVSNQNHITQIAYRKWLFRGLTQSSNVFGCGFSQNQTRQAVPPSTLSLCVMYAKAIDKRMFRSNKVTARKQTSIFPQNVLFPLKKPTFFYK